MSDGLLDIRVVTLGGGTGGFVVNNGLRELPVHAIAICTVFDDGGSTGMLKDEFGDLPKGDVRRCLVALTNIRQRFLRELMNYRFENTNGTSGLSKHSLGNLMLKASCDIMKGDVEGIRALGEALSVHGEVLPISLDKQVQLCAELSDDSTIVGESKIDLRSLDDERTIKKIWLEPSAVICREASDAIINATHIVLGPGDLYTSILPNLKVEGVAESFERSKAKLIYASNLMDKWSETRGYSIVDFTKTLLNYDIGREKFDAVLINTAPIPAELVELYAKKDKSSPLLFTDQAVIDVQPYTHKIVAKDFLNRTALGEQLVRHDSYALARAIIDL